VLAPLTFVVVVVDVAFDFNFGLVVFVFARMPVIAGIVGGGDCIRSFILSFDYCDLSRLLSLLRDSIRIAALHVQAVVDSWPVPFARLSLVLHQAWVIRPIVAWKASFLWLEK
jgi:hypothetical protein